MKNVAQEDGCCGTNEEEPMRLCRGDAGPDEVSKLEVLQENRDTGVIANQKTLEEQGWKTEDRESHEKSWRGCCQRAESAGATLDQLV
jgi:hypothetical protein